MKLSEADIQRAAAKYLNALGVLWCHVANERDCTPRQGAYLKGLGVKSGVPDVLVFDMPSTGEKGLALELKAARGRLQKTQKAWLDELRARGWRTEVARGLDEALEIIKECYGRMV